MPNELAKMDCVPCEKGVPPLTAALTKELHERLGGRWEVVDGHHLEMETTFPDFRQALDYATRVGELAEEQRHHPDIYLAWGRVRLILWTHKINGLSEADFVFAAKVNALQRPGVGGNTDRLDQAT